MLKRKDYHNKDFKNPFFPKHKPQITKKKKKPKLRLVFFLIIIIAGIYFLATSGLFRSKDGSEQGSGNGSAKIVWLTGQQKYFLDNDGVAIKEIQPDEVTIESGQEGTDIIRTGINQDIYPTIYDQSNSLVNIDQEVVTPELVEFITSLNKKLKDNFDFEISHYTIISPFADQISLLTLEGWQVYFRTTESAQAQVNRLMMILQQKIESRSDFPPL